MAIDRKALGPVDAIAWDVFHYNTQRTLAFFDAGLFAISRLVPLNPSFGLQVEFPDFVVGSSAPFATLADYETGLARLDGFAGFMENTVALLKKGRAAGYLQPRIIVENVLKQVDAVLAVPVEDSAFYSAIKRLPPGLEGERARLSAAYRAMIETRVYAGYRLWQTYLRGEYLPAALAAPGRWAMKDGDRLYAAELARHTTTTMTAAAIHALG